MNNQATDDTPWWLKYFTRFLGSASSLGCWELWLLLLKFHAFVLFLILPKIPTTILRRDHTGIKHYYMSFYLLSSWYCVVNCQHLLVLDLYLSLVACMELWLWGKTGSENHLNEILPNARWLRIQHRKEPKYRSYFCVLLQELSLLKHYPTKEMCRRFVLV
ncbi:uncharacterized protein LOC106460322 isoform X5 [Limulus polyphemus]|uniref:Uncharacterized protein LOC106460322 isoform X5 n=1 Tax=Limulus polyphemus TaxID=6850 RepID=A0ABM1SGH9_LIMPO|nr:uncharacterized protein LOC106460322 isoform X5 [Limulus polyphemus]